MKILYIDINLLHINPTANLLPVLFKERFPDARFYGPGFSPRENLEIGIRRWTDREGPFDILIIGPHTPIMVDNPAAKESSLGYMMRYTAHRLSEAAIRRYFGDTLPTVSHLDIPIKLVSALNFDNYAASRQQIDRLLEGNFGILGPNEQFARRVADWPHFAAQEKHYIRKAERISDAWYDFLIAHPNRVVTAVHFVGGHEFSFSPLDKRPWQIAVPGVEYLLRKKAVSCLSRAGTRVAPKTYFHLYRIANFIGLPVYSYYLTLRLYNLLFMRTLSMTRFVYTSSGGSGNLPRKFIEIPAAGAVLVCTPCNGFADLGYEPEQHYIAAEPENLPQTVSRLLHDSRAQEVASAGQALTIARHSLAARGEQIERCLQAMLQGTFRGARWERGEFVVREKIE